jgi:hypothetical protein
MNLGHYTYSKCFVESVAHGVKSTQTRTVKRLHRGDGGRRDSQLVSSHNIIQYLVYRCIRAVTHTYGCKICGHN